MPLCGRLIRGHSSHFLEGKTEAKSALEADTEDKGPAETNSTGLGLPALSRVPPWERLWKQPPAIRVHSVFLHASLPSQAALTTAASSARNPPPSFPREYAPGKQCPLAASSGATPVSTRRRVAEKVFKLFWRERGP